MTLHSELLERHRARPAEAAYWLLLAMVIFVFPQYLAIATTAAVMCLFALSLDLVLGFAGIVTLGHAAYFGIGAYAAALIASGGWHEAISGAMLAGLGAAVVAVAIAPFLLLLEGLPLIMVTMAIGAILFEAGNKANWLTGGDDGLRGFDFAPLLGLFAWTIYGYTAYAYSLVWLFVLFVVARRVVSSPFGVALQGIRENRVRMHLIGSPVVGHLVRAYVLSAFMAGIAGAIYAQTNQFVSLEVLSIDTSVDVVVMLVLGGIGQLYGALIGAPVYVLVKHFAALWNPYNWMFVIGALLIVAVRFGHGGLLGILQLATRWLRGLVRRGSGEAT
jgi:branched-chain amino acid transport system permease protein